MIDQPDQETITVADDGYEYLRRPRNIAPAVSAARGLLGSLKAKGYGEDHPLVMQARFDLGRALAFSNATKAIRDAAPLLTAEDKARLVTQLIKGEEA